MRILSVFIFSSGLAFSMHGQGIMTSKNAPKSAIKKFEKANEHYKRDDYSKANSLYQELISKWPEFIDARIKLGSLCFETRDLLCSEQQFEYVLSLDSFYNPKIYYTLALVQYRLEKYNKAKLNLQMFLNVPAKNSDLEAKAKALWPKIVFADSVQQYKYNIKLEFIESVNTDYSEYLPSIRPDGQIIFFTRRSPRGDEDIYFSERLESGWSEAKELTDINSPFNEGSPSISPDGQSLIFTSCDRKYGYGGCDLYQSHFINGAWSKPNNLGDRINTPAYESQACFADNGMSLFFTSNRQGTYGGFDLWWTRKMEDNNWSIPRNLGPVINTAGDEDCPFLHPNGKTLFFSSNYHPGIGDKDLFYSERTKENGWTKPINMGIPINTQGDESSLLVFPDGKTCWIASDQAHIKEGYLSNSANLDLYQFELPKPLQAIASTYVKISVKDADSKLAVQADVEIYDLNKNEMFIKLKADKNGKVLASLPTGSDYGLHILHNDYLFEPEQFRCSETQPIYKPLILEKLLHKIRKDNSKSIVLHNVLFESGSAQLKPESKFELNALADLMLKNKTIRIRIDAYTDQVGSEEDNYNLSMKRAQSVAVFLKNAEIDISRIELNAHGEQNAIGDNNTEEGRRKNRRIEFTIIE